jgi:hypothetical protein
MLLLPLRHVLREGRLTIPVARRQESRHPQSKPRRGLNHAAPTPKNRKCLFQLLARVSLAWPPINDPSGERRSASPSLRWLSPAVVFPILFPLLTSVYPSRGVFFQRSQREAHFSIFCLILWDREFGCLHLSLFISILRRRPSIRRRGAC